MAAAAVPGGQNPPLAPWLADFQIRENLKARPTAVGAFAEWSASSAPYRLMKVMQQTFQLIDHYSPTEFLKNGATACGDAAKVLIFSRLPSATDSAIRSARAVLDSSRLSRITELEFVHCITDAAASWMYAISTIFAWMKEAASAAWAKTADRFNFVSDCSELMLYGFASRRHFELVNDIRALQVPPDQADERASLLTYFKENSRYSLLKQWKSTCAVSGFALSCTAGVPAVALVAIALSGSLFDLAASIYKGQMKMDVCKISEIPIPDYLPKDGK